MINRFFAMDVELANAQPYSICQLGLVLFENGIAVKEYNYYIKPPRNYFNDIQSKIHGITKEHVKTSPSFNKIHSELIELIDVTDIVIHHNHLEPNAIANTCQYYDLDTISPIWIDTLKIAKRLFGSGGNGLKDLCNKYNVCLNHHDALSDARAVGEIFIKLVNEVDWSLHEVVNIGSYNTRRERREEVTTSRFIKDFRMEGSDEGKMKGQVVFTNSIRDREQMSLLAVEKGCDVNTGVTLKTTILVLGTPEPITSKIKRAQDLIKKGQDIKIILEDEFFELCDNY